MYKKLMSSQFHSIFYLDGISEIEKVRVDIMENQVAIFIMEYCIYIFIIMENQV